MLSPFHRQISIEAEGRWRNRPERENEGQEGDQNTLLCVGRLQWNKNFNSIIKALAAIGACNFLLVIVGDGPDRQRLQDDAPAVGGMLCRSVKDAFESSGQKHKETLLSLAIFVN